VYLNAAMARFLGRTPEEVLGHCDLEPIADAEQVAQIRENDRRILDLGMTECFEESGTSAAGPWTYLFTKSPLRDAEDRIVGIVGLGFDITARKEVEEALKRYAQRLVVVEDELRKQIAVELHDEVGQELAALSFNLTHMERNLTDHVEELRATLVDSRALTKAIHRSVRSLMVSLHPTQLEDEGLVSALGGYVKQYRKRVGISVTLRAQPDFPRLDALREIALFRIVQEALNNVLKHAGAAKVTITLSDDGKSTRLCVSDNGKGFVTGELPRQFSDSGWGLTIMRERAESIGGSFQVVTGPGRGTAITVEFATSR